MNEGDIRYRTVHFVNPVDGKPRRATVALRSLGGPYVSRFCEEVAFSVCMPESQFVRAEGQRRARERLADMSASFEIISEYSTPVADFQDELWYRHVLEGPFDLSAYGGTFDDFLRLLLSNSMIERLHNPQFIGLVRDGAEGSSV